jgi:predicted dehydrogenase
MNTVRWGVLSTARIGTQKVIPAIQRAVNCEVTALASRDAATAERVAGELGIPDTYGTYEDLLAADNLDAVYIPLPNHLHAEWTKAAARAGKHVLCEKPLALSSSEAQTMVDVCSSEGVKFMEAFMYRLHPSWMKVRELVRSEAIGELRAIQARFTYFNDDPDNIRNIAAYGGGALMDIGCYPINVARMLFDGEPTTISAAVHRDPRFGVDTLVSAVLEFGEGQASFVCSTQAENGQSVHLLGTKGRIEVDIPFNIPPDRETFVYVSQGGDPPVAPDTLTLNFPPVDQYTVQAELFAQAILEDSAVPTDPRDGVANMRVIEDILAAAR